MESVLNKLFFLKEEKVNLFLELIVVDGLERYIGVKFFGVKCFLFEGFDVFILMMKEIICYVSC